MLDNPKQGSPTRAPVAALWAAAIAAVAGFAAVYVTFGRSDNAVRPAAETPSTISSLKQLPPHRVPAATP